MAKRRNLTTARHPRRAWPVRGASYVEAVISIPVFVALVLGFIDICRVLLTYIFIQHAAQRAVDWASKVDVEVSTTAAECQPQGSPVDPACPAYRKRVRDIAERAVERARLVAAPSSQAASGSRLVRFRHYDTTTYLAEGIPLWPELGEGLDLDAAFLRPGEAVREIDPRTNSPVGAPIEHSNRQLVGAVPGEGEEGLGWPGSGESWASLLEAHPIEVMVAVDFDPVTPFFPAFRISATQFAYRAIRAFGIPPRVYTPTPTPVPTPTFTLVPIPTPTVGPTPTHTPTPTATPTLSITPTPTETATVTPTPTETPVPSPTPTVDCTPCASRTLECSFEDPMVCAQCSTCPGCNCGSLEEQTG